MARSRRQDRIRLLSMGSLMILAQLLFSFPARAHHSFAAEFNVDDRVEFTGTITDIRWINPHVYMTLEAKSQDGGTVQWQLESFPPLWFHRIGMSRASFPIGQTLTISGWRAKDHSNLMWIKTVRFADGREVAITGDDPAKETQQQPQQ
jgi:hypothetical protein